MCLGQALYWIDAKKKESIKWTSGWALTESGNETKWELGKSGALFIREMEELEFIFFCQPSQQTTHIYEIKAQSDSTWPADVSIVCCPSNDFWLENSLYSTGFHTGSNRKNHSYKFKGSGNRFVWLLPCNCQVDLLEIENKTVQSTCSIEM